MESNHPIWKRKTALFLINQCITLFGSSLVQFAMVWYVTLKTSSGTWVSALTLCSFLPQTVLSLVAGVWADRYSKKALIILSDSIIAAATLVLALLLPALGEGNAVLYALLIVSIIRSLGTGVQMPAVNAMLPHLVPEEQLMRVNGINATVQSIVQFAAPAAAGAILILGTLGSTLWIDIATAAVGVGMLSCIALPAATVCDQPTKRASWRKDLRLGIGYAFSDGFLSKLLLLYGAFIFLCVPSGFLATLFVSRTYGDSYAYLTIVELVGFAGMTAGGLLIGSWGGFANRMKTLLLGLGAFGALTIAMGAIRNFPVYLGFMAVMGIALTMVQTASTTLIQQRSRPDMQGRVFGFFNGIYSGFLPLGMAVFGPLADRLPMGPMMMAAGGVLLLLAIACRCCPGLYHPPVQAQTISGSAGPGEQK